MPTNFMMHLVANGSEVVGEGQQRDYEGWIEVVAYEFAGEKATSGQSGSGRMGAANFSNFVVRKRADRATPIVWQAFAQNATCAVNLALFKTGGEMEKYMEIILTDAIISKIVHGNLSFGGDMADEEIHFSYRRIGIDYEVQDSRTGIVRGGISWEHDIRG
jgi:type VI secretion system secreted protein Hcp